MSQNKQNCGLQSNNTSGCKGVFWSKNRNKWEARIQIDGRQLYLGRFEDIADARKARSSAESKYFGEFARTE
jgi:hypothetical protein